ncbi:WD repeat-containing protein GTS1 [Rhododendron vialii]|uniref:WD repeat-containing protein GTS1 n=1 Tax=Rhododendron vialii TaxID=182163 RepID=UPI00265E38F8|nr:WD repeat-containing protein GTS1 [Rhododendron vialii]
MEEGMEVDVEESEATPNSKHSKRFGLKNTVQTSFGEDYVFQIVPKDDLTSMGVSLSTNAVKLYAPATGQYFGELKGHSSTINQISFSGPTTPNVLHSCSSDGTIRAWDTRSFHQVSSVSAGPSQDIFSFSFGGSGDNLLAAGSKSQIFFWDWRTKKQIACLEESHMDDVTQVHFVPDHQNKLLSASVDGLMCIFDTRGSISDDDHLESVINVGTSIGKVGFLGGASQKLWCLTHIETLSVWDWNDAKIEVNIEDARTLASDSWALDHIDYFVDCHYSGQDDRLWVIGGTSAGTLGYFPVNFKGKGAIGPPEAVLHGGHTGIVRSVLPLSGMQGAPTHTQGGIFGWTGGEDGRLCCWMPDELSDANRSWISSKLVMKSPKICRKSRHHPY